MRLRSILAILVLAACAGVPALAAAPAEKKKGGGAAFIQLPTLTASVLRPTGKRGVLTVEAGLDIPDNNLRERAAMATPRLRDAYVRFLTVYAATVPAGGVPSPDIIGASLQRSTDQVLGKPGAKLLLGTVLIN